MYFITAQDPNYTIKGSRDPLGMQVLWQAAGRRLIPNLSTVSGNIMDFQILSLAHYLKKDRKITDTDFESFFIRFEQLMAYARFQKNKNEGFNGVDRVRKIMNSDRKEVVISNKEEILSNQRAYGIWGKYNRPFTDMGISNDLGFTTIIKAKLDVEPQAQRLFDRLQKKNPNENASISKEDLEAVYPLIDKPKQEERKMYINYLLKDNCENGLANEIKRNPELLKMELYSLINEINGHSVNVILKSILDHIQRTENILSPLERIFRHLQTKAYWKWSELANETYIKSWRTTTDSEGLDEPVASLNRLLSLDNLELIKGIVNRNEQVSKRRNSAPWMRLTDSGLEVNHYEGAASSQNYNPIIHSDHPYFIPTFLSLYSQLH
jgi:hypothetical protein